MPPQLQAYRRSEPDWLNLDPQDQPDTSCSQKHNSTAVKKTPAQHIQTSAVFFFFFSFPSRSFGHSIKAAVGRSTSSATKKNSRICAASVSNGTSTNFVTVKHSISVSPLRYFSVFDKKKYTKAPIYISFKWRKVPAQSGGMNNKHKRTAKLLALWQFSCKFSAVTNDREERLSFLCSISWHWRTLSLHNHCISLVWSKVYETWRWYESSRFLLVLTVLLCSDGTGLGPLLRYIPVEALAVNKWAVFSQVFLSLFFPQNNCKMLRCIEGRRRFDVGNTHRDILLRTVSNHNKIEDFRRFHLVVSSNLKLAIKALQSSTSCSLLFLPVTVSDTLPSTRMDRQTDVHTYLTGIVYIFACVSEWHFRPEHVCYGPCRSSCVSLCLNTQTRRHTEFVSPLVEEPFVSIVSERSRTFSHVSDSLRNLSRSLQYRMGEG